MLAADYGLTALVARYVGVYFAMGSVRWWSS
jgi:hypothetical protein